MQAWIREGGNYDCVDPLRSLNHLCRCARGGGYVLTGLNRGSSKGSRGALELH